MAEPHTLIVGLGNPILGDDGVGWRVATAVRAALDDPQIEIDCLALGGLSLMERLIGYQRAIIIDAIQTVQGQAGAVTVFPVEDLPDLSSGHTTAAHDTSLPTALAVGRRMGAALPTAITIVGVEAPRVYDFTEDLSPAVAAAVPVATAEVVRLVQEAGHAPSSSQS